VASGKFITAFSRPDTWSPGLREGGTHLALALALEGSNTNKKKKNNKSNVNIVVPRGPHVASDPPGAP